MFTIEHKGDARDLVGTEEEWLNEPDLVDTWHIYYRDWAAGPITKHDEVDGSMPLGEVISSIDTYVLPKYEGVLMIAPEKIVEFYPNARENSPSAVVFYDGGGWYWSQECDAGIINSYLLGE